MYKYKIHFYRTQNEGVEITMEEAREPMGAHKKVHIRKITQNEAVRLRYLA